MRTLNERPGVKNVIVNEEHIYYLTHEGETENQLDGIGVIKHEK